MKIIHYSSADRPKETRLMTLTDPGLAAPPASPKCGTMAGYRAHRRRGEAQCAECLAARRRYRLELKARKVAGVVVSHKPPAKCGTLAGYFRHRDNGEDTCPDCRRAFANHKRGYRESNPEIVERERAYGAAYDRRPEVVARRREWRRRYERESPIRRARRRARDARRGRGGGGAQAVTAEVLAGRLAMFGGRCWLCGVDTSAAGLHWDHVKPLAAGGVDCGANLRPACPDCNRAKSSRWPFNVRMKAGVRNGREETTDEG